MYWRSSGPDASEQVAQVPDDREVAQDARAALQQVPAREPGQASADRGGRGSQLHDGLAASLFGSIRIFACASGSPSASNAAWTPAGRPSQ